MKIDINEMPDLAIPVGSFGSATTESAKVIPIIIGTVIGVVFTSEEIENAV